MMEQEKHNMIRILIVDDSPTERIYLEHVIGSEPDMEIAGTAADGEEAVKKASRLRPDVILMDIQLPGMDGYAATRKIMAANPVPIVVVSARIDSEQMNKSFEALCAGASCALEKPTGPGHPGAADMIRKIVQTVRLLAKIKKTPRLRKREVGSGTESATMDVTTGPARVSAAAEIRDRRMEMVVVGASTGGPPVLDKILSEILPSFPIPVLVVQHISRGFLQSMIQWIGRKCPLKVKIAENWEPISPGIVYFAPDDRHMGISKSKRIALFDEPSEHGVRPSVSRLFRTVVSNGFCRESIGVLLTGMGKDGAAELKLMKEGGSTTLVQNKESCVVFGMPGEAVRLHGATHVLVPEEITAFLNLLTKK